MTLHEMAASMTAVDESLEWFGMDKQARDLVVRHYGKLLAELMANEPKLMQAAAEELSP